MRNAKNEIEERVQMTNAEIIRQFKIRCLQCLVALVFGALLVVARAIYDGIVPRVHAGPSAFDLIIFAWFAGSIVFCMVRYRCPACSAVPSSEEPGFSVVLAFPKRCPKCKSPLSVEQ
jgi:hypothetical protein